MATMNLLQMVREFCRRRGLPLPSTVVGAQDDTTQQLWGLMNEGLADLADRYEWPMLRRRIEFTHSNMASRGYPYLALFFGDWPPGPLMHPPPDYPETVLPDVKAILNRTLWDITSGVEVVGPLDGKDWEQLMALKVAPANYSYSIARGGLFIYPVPQPVLGTRFAMEYLSTYAAYELVSLEIEMMYSKDTSTSLFPSQIILQDLKWRWNQTKGLPYAEDMRICEEMVLNHIARSPAPDIVMDNNWGFPNVAGPGLLVAAGSWKI
jgi:hypothetical protein